MSSVVGGGSNLFSKIVDTTTDKINTILKETRTQSEETLRANTLKGTFSLDQAKGISKKGVANSNFTIESSTTFNPLDKLSPELKKKYKSIESELNTTEKSALQGLLRSGKLTMTDSKGKTMIENLYEIKTGSKQSGVNSGQLLKDAVLIMSDRKYITQGPHGTCGAGSMQNHLWSKDPAELLRMVKDIAKSGEFVSRDGTKIKAGTSSLNWHAGDKTTDGSTEDRRDFNIIFQSAVMRSVALTGGDKGMFSSGVADYNVGKDNSDAKSVATGDSAADPIYVTSLLESITGKNYSLGTSFAFGSDSRMKELEKASKAGKQPLALYSADGYFGLHYVVVQKIQDGYVHFQNTAKSKDNGQVDVMSVGDFQKKVRSAIY